MSLGVDIVDMRRLDKPSQLAKAILSDKELILFNNASNKVQFLAGRFASKEAFMKCLKKGLGEVSFKSIEVLYDEHGAPYIFFEDKSYDVSISHDGDYAIAIATI